MDSALYIQDDRMRMKRGYNKILNNQHNNDEIILCYKEVIWRTYNI